jgi:hypothetical protein
MIVRVKAHTTLLKFVIITNRYSKKMLFFTSIYHTYFTLFDVTYFKGLIFLFFKLVTWYKISTVNEDNSNQNVIVCNFPKYI